jgi:8-oxo-dGTP pyrophosphatase MutT (NUDIX family)
MRKENRSVGATTWTELRDSLAHHVPRELAETVATRAGVSLLLRDGEYGIELLFIHRAEDPRDPWSGQMAFPGGREEPDDLDLRATALRETVEEVGLDTSFAEDLGALDELLAVSRRGAESLSITPFAFRIPKPEHGQLTPNEEVQSLHWLPLDALFGDSLRSEIDYPHRGRSLRFPCFRIGERVIWGLTYRIFTNLQALVESTRSRGRPGVRVPASGA